MGWGMYSYTLPDIWPIVWHTWLYMGMADWAKTGKNARSRSRTARAHPKIKVIWTHMRARERWFEVCIAILYLISDLLYDIPGCIWEWLTEQNGRKCGLRIQTARALPKIKVILRHMRARERWFEVCIAILYLITDVLYDIPGCMWEWLTEQKLAKMRARAVGLHRHTLKSRLSGDTWEQERDGLRYV